MSTRKLWDWRPYAAILIQLIVVFSAQNFFFERLDAARGAMEQALAASGANAGQVEAMGAAFRALENNASWFIMAVHFSLMVFTLAMTAGTRSRE